MRTTTFVSLLLTASAAQAQAPRDPPAAQKPPEQVVVKAAHLIDGTAAAPHEG